MHGQIYRTLPGSESMAFNQSNQVNVGDPDSSSSIGKKNNNNMEVFAHKSKQRVGIDGC